MGDVLQDLGAGFAAFSDPGLLFLTFLGVLMGTFVGVLPGIGAIGAMSVLLGVTTQLGPEGSLVLFSGIYFGAVYGGSISSILLNVPGTPTAVVSAIDGYEMTKRGRAGAALSLTAISSFVAGTVAIVGLMLFAPMLSRVAVRLGPPEYMALTIAGLLILSALSTGPFAKSIVMIAVGLGVGTIGIDPATASLRFTFGSSTLAEGIGFIALVMGVFGVSEALSIVARGDRQISVSSPTLKELLPTKEEARRSVAPTFRGSAIGFGLGLVPGPAPVLSTFASYVTERRLSKRPEEFGKGAVEGVTGPEAANNAAVGASFVPLLVLGIPFTPSIALILAALVLNGIVPGPNFVNEQSGLFWIVIAAMYIGNFMLLALNLPLVGLFTRILAIPPRILAPIIIGLCIVGTYADRNSILDLWVLFISGGIGYLLRRSGYSMATFVLAVVLQPTMETSLRQTMSLSGGDPSYLLGRPVALVVLCAVAITLVMRFVKRSPQTHEPGLGDGDREDTEEPATSGGRTSGSE